MGAVVDENTGEPVLCPYCGKEGECQHLLAIIDRSFLEISPPEAFNRVGAMLGVIEHAFERRLADVAGMGDARHRWRNPLLDELWDSALEARRTSKVGDPVDIDMQIFYDLFVNLLEMAGGCRYPGMAIEDSGPGFASSLTILHAPDPSRALEKAYATAARLTSVG